jgi:hypothetical protein
MPRQTRETELPKPPAAPLDWVKIAESGKVWDFIEGEDFAGKVESFRARKKTEARKAGVDFDSREVVKNGITTLKIKAHLVTHRRVSRAREEPSSSNVQLELTSPTTADNQSG